MLKALKLDGKRFQDNKISVKLLKELSSY